VGRGELPDEPRLTLSSRYVGAEEIFNFYRARAVEYGVYEHAKFNHKVVGAEWVESAGKWTVKVQDTVSGEVIEDSAEVVINCAGVLK
jgi:cation diffusion facilitator CzcD-associated flavoprotein CzcO